MGTRARIATKTADGFKSIYTHWDGYPSHHGPILLGHYATQDKVDKLIALGDLSSLGARIGTKHDFDKPPEGVCNAYGRDRGETNIEPQQSPSLAALSKLTQDTGGEYLYVFSGGAWFGAKGGIAFFGAAASKEPGALVPLAELVAEEQQAEAKRKAAKAAN